MLSRETPIASRGNSWIAPTPYLPTGF
jgi:hypothetical protein